jgi:hypothetical protein
VGFLWERALVGPPFDPEKLPSIYQGFLVVATQGGHALFYLIAQS